MFVAGLLWLLLLGPVLFPLLLLLILVVGVALLVLWLLLLLLLLLLNLLQDPLEVVLVVDVVGVQAERFLVRLQALLQVLPPVEGVAQIVPRRACQRRVSALDRPAVGVARSLVLLGPIERAAVVEEGQRQVGRVAQRLQVLLVRLLVAALLVEAVALVHLRAPALGGEGRGQSQTPTGPSSRPARAAS